MNTIVVLISLVLCVYWFRYMCLLILRERGGRNYAGQVASANQLMFLRAKALLDSDGEEMALDAGPEYVAPQTLDRLAQSLDRDYRVMTYLLRNAAEYCRFRTMEYFVLMVDFHLMRAVYRALRGLSPRIAKNALLEMALIVRHLAQSAGEQLIARKA